MNNQDPRGVVPIMVLANTTSETFLTFPTFEGLQSFHNATKRNKCNRSPGPLSEPPLQSWQFGSSNSMHVSALIAYCSLFAELASTDFPRSGNLPSHRASVYSLKIWLITWFLRMESRQQSPHHWQESNVVWGHQHLTPTVRGPLIKRRIRTIPCPRPTTQRSFLKKP